MKTKTSLILICIMLILGICEIVNEFLGTVSGPMRMLSRIGLGMTSLLFAGISLLRWQSKYSVYWDVRGCPEKKSPAYYQRGNNWKTGNPEIDGLHDGYILWVTAFFLFTALFTVSGLIRSSLIRQ